ncbi:hypothetical protein [Paraburkholderia sp. SIMBA_054]|uniref:hypothetical protein n=1 Tax=Paraburkholderia sp. SIMBA_054 TaxID=3085795 RepID=UPI00397D9E26
MRAGYKSVKDAGPLLAGMTSRDAAAFLSVFIHWLAVQARGARRVASFVNWSLLC